MKSRSILLFVFAMMAISSRSQIVITFNVDMTGQTIESGGVHIAGEFAMANAISITSDWQPNAPGSQLTKTSANIYSVQVTFSPAAAGKKLQFEFVRNDVWFGTQDFSEGNPGDLSAHIDNSCGVPDGTGGYNRIITIPECGGKFDAVFNHCGLLTPSTTLSLTTSRYLQVCLGESVQLHATSNGSVLWSPATGLSCNRCNDPVASPAVTTWFVVTASNGGCSVIDSLLVMVDTSFVNAGNDQTITAGSGIQLNGYGASSFMWEPSIGLSCTNCSSPIASPPVTTSYIVHGTSTNGCKTSDTVTVNVSKSPCENIFFPSVFTPNNDNMNDKFGPLCKVSILSGLKVFKVYNRWGDLIFETKDGSFKWDGRSRGVEQPAGSYVYYFEIDCNGLNTLFKGVVTLIR